MCALQQGGKRPSWSWYWHGPAWVQLNVCGVSLGAQPVAAVVELHAHWVLSLKTHCVAGWVHSVASYEDGAVRSQ